MLGKNFFWSELLKLKNFIVVQIFKSLLNFATIWVDTLPLLVEYGIK
jgi:hypothetical protein